MTNLDAQDTYVLDRLALNLYKLDILSVQEKTIFLLSTLSRREMNNKSSKRSVRNFSRDIYIYDLIAVMHHLGLVDFTEATGGGRIRNRET